MRRASQAVLEETVLQPDGLRLALRLAGRAGALRYRLEALRAGASLLRYDNESARGPQRVLAGRAAPYAFRSVEQLRYDFERDLEALP